jgi:hypothetical protein
VNNNLTLLVLIDGDDQSPMQRAVQEWNQANLFGSVGWMSSDTPNRNGTFQVNIESHVDGSQTTSDFFDLLTSKIWDAVTVVGLRDRKQNEISQEYFAGELCLLDLVRSHLSANKEVVVRGITVGIADETQHKGAFPPQWDVHLLHEPILYIDTHIASQPLTDEYRATSVLLLGVLASGGFRWQYETLIGGLKDPSLAMKPTVRIARANLRVVNAGRLTDKILAGAFPESGPWSQPRDVRNGVAMPMGAQIPAAVVESLAKEAKFDFQKWTRPGRKAATQVGVIQGMRLFLTHFVKFLRQVPSMIIEDFKQTIGDKVANAAQHLTFGADSEIQLAYRPNNNLSSDEVLALVRKSGMPELDSPIADSKPWNVLRTTAFCLVDGGKLPDGVEEPLRGVSRMLFLDPNCIGPQVSETPFEISAQLQKGLGLREGLTQLKSLDVENSRMLRSRLTDYIAANKTNSAESEKEEKVDSDKVKKKKVVIGHDELSQEYVESTLAGLDKWIDERKDSLLWKVAATILLASDTAREEMADAFKGVPTADIAMEAEQKAHERARKWTIRGLIGLGLVALISILGTVFAVLSVFVAIGIAFTYIIAFVVRCATLARDLAALQFARVEKSQEFQLQLLRGQHSARELVRLVSVRSQLNEWQEIIREVVHAPFGRRTSFASGQDGISAIECPPQFVLATADPSDDQMTAAMSGAKDQTIHAGWLNETFETMRKIWSDLYRKWSAAGPGDDLSPEMDNVDSEAVRGFRPLTKETILYPRSDFHRAVLTGILRDGLVQSKVDQIATNLRRTPLKELLAQVSVTGLGRALSGQNVDRFLDGLTVSKEDIPIFNPDLFSVKALALRTANVDITLPPTGETQTHALSESVRPGEELVAVAARIDLSTALPFENLVIGESVGQRQTTSLEVSGGYGESPV